MYELKKLKKAFSELNETVKGIGSKVISKDELWDNADMIKNWKVSARTLAEWRAKGIIGFIQVGHKIWYPRESRELFLAKYFVSINNKIE